jgi:transposase
MEVLHSRCAGLDVHKKTVVACVRIQQGVAVEQEVRTFETTTSGLLDLSAWLSEKGCTPAAMEATGVYWKPVWHILADGEFELMLANAAHVKNVPRRKTDVNDATWLSELAAHGLIRGSFVPDRPTQELRSLLRTRKQLVRERSSHIQRLQKTLEDGNIKLDSVISDILGVSGRAMIEAMIAGQTDPAVLARMANQRIRATPDELREALRGRLTAHHRFLPAPSGADQCPRSGDRADRRGGQDRSRPLSSGHPDRKDRPGLRRSQRPICSFRNRRRDEPLSLGRPSPLLGLHLPAQ